MNPIFNFLGILFLIIPFISGAAPNKRNVLFLMADDFNYWLGAAGANPQAHTPNLDKLARKGVIFDNAYNASPVCNPSRNAIQSGYRPHTTGITGNGEGFIREKPGFENVVTLHQYFKENGYFVFGGGKIWHNFVMQKTDPHIDPTNWSELVDPKDYGFWNGCNGPDNLSWADNGDYATSWYKYKRLTIDTKDCDGYLLSQEFVKKIKGYPNSVNKDKPFFMAVGEFRPHLPLESPQKFWDIWKTSEIADPKGYNPAVWDKLGVVKSDSYTKIMAAGKFKEAIHAYLASMAYADSSLGIVLDALDASPYKDNTIVVFCGDHGWHLGEKADYAKAKHWDQANHTTLIIYDPAAKGNGKISKKIVSLQDLYPTLVELAGLPSKNDIEGESLTPLLDDPGHATWNHPVLITLGDADYLKTQEWSYLPDWKGKQYLFNRTTDPYEWTNVWDANPGVRAVLQKQMDSIIYIGTQLKTKLLAKTVFKNTVHTVPGIIQAEDYDDGAEGQDFHDTNPVNTGSKYRTDGVDIEVTSDNSGSFEVTNTAAGEWLIYSIPNFKPGTYSLTARVRSSKNAGKVAVFIDEHPVGILNIVQNINWTDVSIGNILINGLGQKKLKIVISEGAPDLNYFGFSQSTKIGKFTLHDKGTHSILNHNQITDGKLTLNLSSLNIMAKLQIYTQSGSLILEDVVAAEVKFIYDLNGRLPKGKYILKVQDWDGAVRTEQFVKI